MHAHVGCQRARTRCNAAACIERRAAFCCARLHVELASVHVLHSCLELVENCTDGWQAQRINSNAQPLELEKRYEMPFVLQEHRQRTKAAAQLVVVARSAREPQ